jgi:ATP-dependent exoDNAse (exonuclease V) beta subunit
VTDDAPARARIRFDHATTLFVEAGAGTGKTTALVDRVAELVMSGAVPLRSIAAITFTEAAAGELRDRVREALEVAAAAGDPADDPRAGRAAEALTEIDAAAITTLHGFARRLLEGHPFEAELPPSFEVADEIRSAVDFEDRWTAFLDQLLDDEALVPALRRALVVGVQLDQLRLIARDLERNWDLVDDHRVDAPPLAPIEAGDVVGGLQRAIALADRCVDDDDRLLDHVLGLEGFLHRLEAVDDDLELLQLLGDAPSLRGSNKGRKENWDGCVDEVRGALDAAQRAVETVRATAGEGALRQILVALAQLTLDAAAARRREGRLQFHDLLVLARRLLREHPAVGRELATTYARLLIDEFQDTDPIQAELAFRLAAPEPAARAPWSALDPTAGRLFFVGDPKQAIYRFRRADIELFMDVQQACAIGATSLTRNHRSVPGVVAWINEIFGALMGEGAAGSQPAYVPLVATRPDLPDPDRAGPAVVVLGHAVEGERLADIREREATEIAGMIRRIRAEEWSVSARDRVRPARLRDICVLIPTRTSLPALEHALDAAHLPYRVESSSLVYATQEVRDLLNVLRAIDDPTDAVSVVAALRSPLFGCGDDDLVAHRRAHGSWDYRKPVPDALGPDHPVTAGMAALDELHERRWWHDVSELIDELLTRRRAYELALDNRRPRDVWRRLRFVTDQARVFTDAYGPDLRRYLAWADLQSAEDARVVEAVLPETDDDAVRIMTVHASKGLEFPIVVLAGLNVEWRRPSGARVLWGPDGPEVAASASVRTRGFKALDERDVSRDLDEQIRVAYVAATRARDHLIVSLHHRLGRKSHAATIAAVAHDHATRWPAPADDAPPAPAEPPTAGVDATTGSAVAVPLPLGDTAADREAWIGARQRLDGAGSLPVALAATTVAKLGDASADGDEDDERDESQSTPWQRGRAGTAIGRAVHAVLQAVDLSAPDAGPAPLAALSRVQATAEGVPERHGEVERLVRVALDAPIVRTAASGARHWRELYVGTPLGDRVIEGFVDLLVEEDDGLIVVDYKTDAARADDEIDAALGRYRLQGATYAVALETRLGRPVRRCVFLFLRARGPAVEREVSDLPAAVAEVRARVAALAAAAASTGSVTPPA